VKIYIACYYRTTSEEKFVWACLLFPVRRQLLTAVVDFCDDERVHKCGNWWLNRSINKTIGRRPSSGCDRRDSNEYI